MPIPFTDGFESGDLSHLTWITAGAAPWFVQTNVVADGLYAAKSGAIGDSQTSSLTLTTNFNAGIGSFDFKVSSETNWDFLKFTVDGVLYKQWSGEVGWANYVFALNPGTHTLAWSYAKDPSDMPVWTRRSLTMSTCPSLLRRRHHRPCFNCNFKVMAA